MWNRTINQKLDCILQELRFSRTVNSFENALIIELLTEIRDAVVDQAAARLLVYIDGKEIEEMETRVLSTEQKVTATLTPVTAGGKPAKVEPGSVKWIKDGDAVSATPSDDGLSCVFAGVTAGATVVVHAEADADLGEGVTNISSAEFAFETVEPQAASLGVVLGPNEQQ